MWTLLFNILGSSVTSLQNLRRPFDWHKWFCEANLVRPRKSIFQLPGSRVLGTKWPTNLVVVFINQRLYGSGAHSRSWRVEEYLAVVGNLSCFVHNCYHQRHTRHGDATHMLCCWGRWLTVSRCHLILRGMTIESKKVFRRCYKHQTRYRWSQIKTDQEVSISFRSKMIGNAMKSLLLERASSKRNRHQVN